MRDKSRNELLSSLQEARDKIGWDAIPDLTECDAFDTRSMNDPKSIYSKYTEILVINSAIESKIRQVVEQSCTGMMRKAHARERNSWK
jgi:hypothetical protein